MSVSTRAIALVIRKEYERHPCWSNEELTVIDVATALADEFERVGGVHFNRGQFMIDALGYED